MLRPGPAGSFTASDHIAVVDAAMAQLPPQYRTDVLVTVDGAGASHGLVDHLTGLNTAVKHGKRGRRMEYSVGWPVDARTRAAIDAVREDDWTSGLTAGGKADDKAQMVELTGLLRHSVGGGYPAGWPADMRVFARCTPRAPGEQAELGQDANWRYGAFATCTQSGQVQWLDARHRTQAHVEDKMKESKACGAERLPSKGFGRNSAWLQLVTLDGELARAEPKMLRFRIFSAPARHVVHARNRVLKIPPGWTRVHALHPAWTPHHRTDDPGPPAGQWNRRPPEHIGHPVTPTRPHHVPDARHHARSGPAEQR